MSTPSATPLFRPVGLIELRLIAELGFRAFPPRLPEQPIFYPVLSRAYAAQIADEWNTKDEASGFAGFVTRFDVDADYLKPFDVQVVGSSAHEELWIPAEELQAFNEHIRGAIEVIDSFYGTRFAGRIDAATRLPVEIL